MSASRTLQDFLIAVHFRSPLSLTLLDVVDWIEFFRQDFPDVNELPTGARVDINPTPQVSWQLTPPISLPRIVLRARTIQISVQLQDDRFIVGWTRSKPLGESDAYPGFDVMRDNWIKLIQRFYTWATERLGAVPESRLLELAYHNAIPFNEGMRLSEIFRFVQPGRPVNGLQVNWAEFVSAVPPLAHVGALAYIGTAPPATNVFAFNFTGLGHIDRPGNDPIPLSVLDALHLRIREMHAAAINEEKFQRGA